MGTKDSKELQELVKKARETAGERLKLYRESKKMSHAELAQQITVSGSSMVSAENNNRPLTDTNALEIALAYGDLSLDYLFGLRTNNERDFMTDIVFALGKIMRIKATPQPTLFIHDKFYEYLKAIQDLQSLRLDNQSVISDEAFKQMRRDIQENYKEYLSEIFEMEDVSIKSEKYIEIGAAFSLSLDLLSHLITSNSLPRPNDYSEIKLPEIEDK